MASRAAPKIQHPTTTTTTKNQPNPPIPGAGSTQTRFGLFQSVSRHSRSAGESVITAAARAHATPAPRTPHSLGTAASTSPAATTTGFLGFTELGLARPGFLVASPAFVLLRFLLFFLFSLLFGFGNGAL